MKLTRKTLRMVWCTLLTLVVVSSLMLATAPAMAAGTSVSISPASQSVDNGETFEVGLVISTDIASRGWQATVNYDPTKLTANSFTQGGFLKDWATAHGDGTSDQSIGIDNVNGQVKISYLVTGVSDPGGPDGSGTLCTISFTAQNSVNAAASLTLSNVVVSNVNAQHITGVLANSGTVTIGNPALPDLVVSAASTTAVSGNPDQYNITYTVTNSSPIAAGAFTTSIAINGVDIPELAGTCSGLGGNASTTVTTTVPQTVGSTNVDSIFITVDSGPAVTESNESNNTRTTVFVYVPESEGSTVPIDSFIPGEYTLTAPDPISGWNLKTTLTKSDEMNIVANVDWQVTVQAQVPSDGHMVKYSSSTQQWDTNTKLHTALAMQATRDGSAFSAINVSAEAQSLATGDPSTQDTDADGGDAITVDFTQPITYQDAALDNNHTYRIILIFSISNQSF